MPTEYDERSFPITLLRPVGDTTDQDLAERFAFLERQLGRLGTGALIFDTRQSNGLSASHRQQWSSWLERNGERIRKHVVFVGIPVDSAAQRGIFTAVFWLWKPTIPCVFVATEAEAFRLAEQAIAQASAGATADAT